MSGERVDLGGGFSYLRYVNDREEWCGIILRCPHDDTGVEWSGGSIPFENAAVQAVRPRWHVTSFDPLTLEPSILIACGCHGFIREGRWVPA